MVCMLLCACGIRDDTITQYAEETLQINGAKIMEKQDLSDEYGHTDVRYTLQTKDGISFHILKDITEGLTGETEWIWDDYRFCALQKMQERFLHASVESSADSQGMQYAEVYGSYNDRNGLEELLDELTEQLDGSLLVNVHLCYEQAKEAYMAETEEQNAYTVFTDAEAAVIRNHFLHAAIEECRSDLLNAFTEDEIHAYMTENEHCILTEQDGQHIVQKGLLGNVNFHGLSFAGVYELMQREGFLLQGTPEEFSFAGQDGIPIEVSMQKPDSIAMNGSTYFLQNPGHIRTIELRVLTGRFYAEQYELDRGGLFED